MVSFPHCKINIGLQVTAKRDDGFHDVQTVMYPVDWRDVLEIVPAEGNQQVEFKTSGIRVYGTKEQNLCVRAYNLLSSDFSLPPVRIHLHKIIPIGAGLGGGSSDAAYTISLLNRIFQLRLEPAQLSAYAAKLGSDCPFFLGARPVIATGKGDILEPVKLNLKDYYIVIVKPRIHVSTAAAYGWIKPRHPGIDLRQAILQPVEKWKDLITNDFENEVFERYPTVKNIRARLYKQGAVYASMSGSGSSVYGIFSTEKHLQVYFRSSTVWAGQMTLPG